LIAKKGTSVSQLTRRWSRPLKSAAAQQQSASRTTITLMIESFVGLVREYLAAVDDAVNLGPHAFLSTCARVLPRIYAHGLELPDTEPADVEFDADVASPMSRLTGLLGQYNVYAEVFDPCIDKEFLTKTISDDLADIYLDLKRPLLAFEAGKTANAVWQWKFNLQTHCGEHLVDVLRPIHRLINDHMPSDYTAREQAG
jgi:hypothetical protein